MDKQINWDAMRIRLEFLYRVLNWTNLIGQKVMRMRDEELQRVISLMATGGLQVAYCHRIDGQWVDSEKERNDATTISHVIANEFELISDNIRIECAGLPITLVYIRQEAMIQEGIDRIMSTLRELIEGKEVARG